MDMSKMHGVTCFVTDDLSIKPMMPFASIELLNKLGHKDLSLLEKKNSEPGYPTGQLCFFLFLYLMCKK